MFRDRDKLNALLGHHGLHTLDEKQHAALQEAVEKDQQKFWQTVNDALHEEGIISKDINVNAISATEFEAAKGSHGEVARMRTRINESVDLLARATAAQAGHAVPTKEDYISASNQIQTDLAGVFTTKDGRDTLVTSKDAKLGNESFTIGRPDVIDVDRYNKAMSKYNPALVN